MEKIILLWLGSGEESIWGPVVVSQASSGGSQFLCAPGPCSVAMDSGSQADPPRTAALGSSSLSVVSKSVTKQEKQTLAVHCHYDQYYRSYVKYWCKGDKWHYCSSLKRTGSPETPGDKITIRDDQTRGVFTVTMRGLEKEDAGWYWCAIEKLWSDLGISLNLTVVDGK
ncbi:UNVERIFIED_CONTAM: hypothetical protein FKN15_035821 [Acipenser sinensis]